MDVHSIDPGVFELHAILGLLFFLYAEIHYTFRWFPVSFYKKRHPEILADVPFRVEPGRDIPVLILVKDSDRYPVTLEHVMVSLNYNGRSVRFGYYFSKPLKQKWFHRTVHIPRPPGFTGHASVDVAFTYRRKKKTFNANNDNYKKLSNGSFTVLLAEDAVPVDPGWVFGDLHTHTSYTDDQVEFGAPVDAVAAAAQAAGLKFFAATDHSYDLDDLPDNFLKNDPQLRKWQNLLFEVSEMNRENSGKMVVIPGEEVSCRNSAGRNVHLLLLNQEQFVPGSGDGGEKWFRTRSEKSIADVVEEKEENALAIAAHPRQVPTRLERILVRRGSWGAEDLDDTVPVIQILNGALDRAFYEGFDGWIAALLEGRRTFIVAGNDAHGNFNRFRQIRIPMLKMAEEHEDQILGWARTGVYLGDRDLTVVNIVSAVRSGKAVVSTGPFADVVVIRDSIVARMGDVIEPGAVSITVSARSTPEFGKINRVKLIQGVLSEIREEARELEQSADPYSADWMVRLDVQTASYFRCEVYTDRPDSVCFTNPVWVRS